MLPPIGVANVLFVTLTFPLLRQRLLTTPPRLLLAFIGVFGCFVLLYLWRSAPANPKFLVSWHLALFLVINLAILAALARPVANPAAQGLQLLCALSQNRIWIYGLLPDTPHPAVLEDSVSEGGADAGNDAGKSAEAKISVASR